MGADDYMLHDLGDEQIQQYAYMIRTLLIYYWKAQVSN
jgi:hypothetical protein